MPESSFPVEPSTSPSFEEYSAAIKRLRRRAHQRRALMVRDLTASLEFPIVDEQERLDREICQQWSDIYGVSFH